jgi:hypothetical protein
MSLRAGVAKLAGVALAGSLLIFAAPAAAKPCTQATGNSEVDQYLENVPGPCGNQGIGGNGGHHGTSSGSGSGSSSSASGLPSGTISQLESSGPAGAQAASFARQTDPTGTGANGGGSNGSSNTSPSGDEGTSSSGDGSLLSALEHLVTGNEASANDTGQGLGTILPILLAVVLLGGVAVLALRRRRTS